MSRKLHLQEIPLHDPFVFACEKHKLITYTTAPE